MKLKVDKIDKDEIRKGIIRIKEENRKINGELIKSGTLIILKNGNQRVIRIVYGIEGNTKEEKNIIKMDEYTRNILEVENGKVYNFNIEPCDTQPKKIINEMIYFWNHPEIIINFPVRIALISMVFSMIISIISIMINMLN